MAEEPCLLTMLLYEKRYADFLAAVKSHGLLLLDRSAKLEAEVAKLHAALSDQRHPPGPTVEWMVIDRLILAGVLGPGTRDHLK
jgi:hypothetical protein